MLMTDYVDDRYVSLLILVILLEHTSDANQMKEDIIVCTANKFVFVIFSPCCFKIFNFCAFRILESINAEPRVACSGEGYSIGRRIQLVQELTAKLLGSRSSDISMLQHDPLV